MRIVVKIIVKSVNVDLTVCIVNDGKKLIMMIVLIVIIMIIIIRRRMLMIILFKKVYGLANCFISLKCNH